MAARRRTGFTLIEMMAVITLVGMIFALGLPRLSSSRWRALGEAAESVASSLEFARQRAIMTGAPHRVRIDLENGGWRVEWLVTEQVAMAAANGAPASSSAPDLTPATNDPTGAGASDLDGPIDLHPKEKTDLAYYPIASKLGSVTFLDDTLYFVGFLGSSGWIEGGEAWIDFDADGTTDLAWLELADADDRHMTLEIEPVLDRIRRREGEARL